MENLLDLQENTDIILKEAIKGSTVVIMDTKSYKELAIVMLVNNEYFENTIHHRK